MKKYFAFIIIILLCLTDYTYKYSRQYIINYAENELKISNYTVSNTYRIRKGNYDHYKDNIWTVIDKDNDIKFYVIDNEYKPKSTIIATDHDINTNCYSKLYLKKYIN